MPNLCESVSRVCRGRASFSLAAVGARPEGGNKCTGREPARAKCSRATESCLRVLSPYREKYWYKASLHGSSRHRDPTLYPSYPAQTGRSNQPRAVLFWLSATTEIHQLTDGVTAVDVEFGYREPLRVFDALLSAADRPGSAFTAPQVVEATLVLSTEAAVPSRESALSYWEQQLYIALRRRQQPWSAHAQLPPSQTVIIGREVSL